MNNGYIKLWRCIDESSLWQMPIFDIILAVRILTLAKWTDDLFVFPSGEKVKLKRGQLIGGYQWLAKMMPDKSGATIQKIRTALKHLEHIEFISCSSNRLSNSHYIIITVLKYNNFQADNADELTDQSTVELTDHQQPPNRPPTPSKEVIRSNKKVKEEKNTTNTLSESEVNVLNKEWKWLIESWNQNAPKHLQIIDLSKQFNRNDVFACRNSLDKLNLEQEQIITAIKNWFNGTHWYSERRIQLERTLRQFLADDKTVRKMAFYKQAGRSDGRIDLRSDESRRIASNYDMPEEEDEEISEEDKAEFAANRKRLYGE